MARKPKEPPKNPVLDEHVPIFEGYMRKWRKLLNLMDWRIERKPGRSKGAMACIVSTEHEHKLAKYQIGADFGSTPVNNDSLERIAIHEMLHIRFAALLDTAFAEGEYNDSVMEQEHSCIVVMEELLMPAIGDPEVAK